MINIHLIIISSYLQTLIWTINFKFLNIFFSAVNFLEANFVAANLPGAYFFQLLV